MSSSAPAKPNRLRKWLDAFLHREPRAQLIGEAKRIVVGAGRTSFPGWFATDRATLDLLEREDFTRHWAPGTRTAFLAEHVWEHLSEEQGKQAAANCFEFLRHGGRLRLAVPDGWNPDPEYREYVRPGGSGPGADDHKVLYTAATLTAALESVGFTCALLEYWDEAGKFHATDWNPNEGNIARSIRFDPRNQDGATRYTSLIVDAIKP